MSSRDSTNDHDAEQILNELSQARVPKKKKVEADPLIPSVLHPRFFRPLEVFCRDALRYGGNAVGLRESLVSLVNTMRAQAVTLYGHDTPDVLMLSKLIAVTSNSEAQRAAELQRHTLKDPVAVLRQQSHIDVYQQEAADLIREVWAGFDRYLSVCARSYEHNSMASKSKALDPISVMGPVLLNSWHYIYIPWYESATKRRFATRTDKRMIPNARIVLYVVRHQIFPGDIDKMEHLKRGTSLQVLKNELLEVAKLQERVDVNAIASHNDQHADYGGG